MKSKKKFLKIAIDSPAAAGAGTIAKKISKYYNLFYLDTGKIYRMIANIKLKFPKKFNEEFLKKKINSLNLRDLQNKKLINDEVGAEAAVVSKLKKIRRLVHSYQINCAYNPPKKYNGSCLDGRDITYNIVPDADFKFFITASAEVRAERRHKELLARGEPSIYARVLDDMLARDERDRTRSIAPLRPASDAKVIDTSELDADTVLATALRTIKAGE